MQSHRTPKQSLRHLFTQLITIIDKQSAKKKINKKKPLILDKATKRILFSLFNINEIISLGIMVTEQLENSRQQLDANAVYFIQPTQDSVERIIGDFSVKHNYQYSSVNIIFNGNLSEELMEKISKQQHLVKRINTFQEFHLNLVFFTENLCTLNIEESLSLELNNELVEKMAKNLFILASPNEFSNNSYEIHYLTNPLCQGIANVLAELIKGKPKKNTGHSELVTIVIVDRMLDPVSPLVHSFFYGPLLRDIKKVENNFIITGEGKNRNVFYFDDTDTIITKFKNKHISEVSELIVKQIKAYREKSELSKFQQGKGNGELKGGITQIAQFNKTSALHNFHIALLNEVIDYFKTRNLSKIMEVENMILSGLNSEGVQKSEKEVFVQCYNLLTELDQNSEERMRLMVLMLMCMQIPKDREAIIKSLRSFYKKNILKGLDTICPKILKLKEKKIKQKEYVLRHCPKLSVVCGNIEGKKENPGMKVNKISSGMAGEKGLHEKKICHEKQRAEVPKCIVMMAGPLGWNQVSYIERQSNKYQYSFLSSRMCTQSQYISQIIKISSE